MGSPPLRFQSDPRDVEYVGPLRFSPLLRRRSGESLLPDPQVLESASGSEERTSSGAEQRCHPDESAD